MKQETVQYDSQYGGEVGDYSNGDGTELQLEQLYTAEQIPVRHLVNIISGGYHNIPSCC